MFHVYFALFLMGCTKNVSADTPLPPTSNPPASGTPEVPKTPPQRPNFLFIISDDQSWIHTSMEAYPFISTPNFDEIAKNGLYFQNAFAAAPSCTPSRSAIITGQEFWQLESGAVLLSDYPSEKISYQHVLQQAGYVAGFTGKGWGPGRTTEADKPTGQAFNRHRVNSGDMKGEADIVANFEEFLGSMTKDVPFSFWIGSKDPHRPFSPDAVNRFENQDMTGLLPAFLPDTEQIRFDLSGYLYESERFDQQVGEILALLKRFDRYDNTVIVITSDNGMDFGRAKPQNYTYGVQVPLAIYWTGLEDKGEIIDDFIQLSDIAPTFIELAGVEVPAEMTGESLVPYMKVAERGRLEQQERDAAYSGYERHAPFIRGGELNLTYPRRAVYTKDFVYIRNYHPERWPAGDPPVAIEGHPIALSDADGNPLEPYYSLSIAKRPAEELYDLRVDPDQMVNVAANADYAEVLETLRNRLLAKQQATQDPILEDVDYFQQFPSYP
ncbi:MAG: sulfatase [Trueperaceae bacterium]|nr:sulfatase [Trueperaceae bacterium]